MNLMRMDRWVKQTDRRVEFGNIVGGHMGRPYIYKCATTVDAKRFAEYARQRDPECEDMPIAITEELARERFRAVRLKNQ